MKLQRRPHLVPALLVIGLIAGCERVPDTVEDLPAIPVSVFETEGIERDAVVKVAGVVQPDQRAGLGTRQAGTVEAVFVEAGDRVEAEQPILQVDARDLEAARSAARLQVQAARAASEQAEQNRRRFERLYEQELVARIRKEEAQIEADSARGLLAQAEAELAAIEVNLDYATLRAPFDGIVSEVIAETGTFVAPGPPLVVFEDRGRLNVEAGIDQASSAQLQPGQELPMSVSGIDATLTGRVQAVLPGLEDIGVGLRLRLVIDDPPEKLEPGMVAEIEVPSGMPARTLTAVPESALLRRGQLEGVFVVETDDEGELRARLRWINPGDADPDTDRIEVVRGLSGGERVVVGDAVTRLSDNQRVTILAGVPD
ncbi:MAG: efflux RND transporter periplasmic adaptor subunit [Thioalkalivibrio sp.]|nr:MAG: efflux RND transporter periplasmic adaptor subunit [Thioalkalivibrio sp.]